MLNIATFAYSTPHVEFIMMFVIFLQETYLFFHYGADQEKRFQESTSKSE